MKRALILLAACGAPQQSGHEIGLSELGTAGLAAIVPSRIEATTKFLSSDALAGREPGSPGGTRAEDYIAEQMRAIGLETSFQDVPLRRADRDDAHTSLVVNGTIAFTQGVDAQLWAEPRTANVEITAPLAFVGFGIATPGYDDLTGVDLHGKIAVIYMGAPRAIGGRTLDSAEHAVLSDVKPRSVALKAAGAVAMIAIFDPVRAERTPFEGWLPKVVGPTMAWLEGKEVGSLPVLPLVTIGEAGAAKFAPEIHAAWTDLDRGVVTRPAFTATAALRITSTLTDIRARNVVGMLRGKDPKAGTVIYTAHHDHLGIGPPIDGDKIYNGALDNAIGCAGLLEVARAFAALPDRPARSILFVAVTGEEKGLLGSDYYAAHPTVPDLVANINIDGLGGLWEPHDMIPLGAEHSTIGAHAAAAAAALGFAISPDPEPAQVAFIRSDQYSFVKRGIPAVFPGAGYLDPQGGREANRKVADAWGTERYHRPSDEWFPGVHAEWAAPEAAFDFLMGLSIATTPARPHWNAGDAFARFAHP